MLILPFIPFSGKAWAFFVCSLAIGHHCSIEEQLNVNKENKKNLKKRKNITADGFKTGNFR
jgi:hypothetical protein